MLGAQRGQGFSWEDMGILAQESWKVESRVTTRESIGHENEGRTVGLGRALSFSRIVCLLW